MENRYSYYRQGDSVLTSIKNEEFQEEDVWGDFKQRKDSDSWAVSSLNEPDFNTNHLSTATRTIPKSNKNPNSQEYSKIIHHSAPVNIPDWSKIYGTTSKQNSKQACSSLDDDQSDVNDHGFARSSWESDDEEEEDEDVVIPPHELIARKLARNQISSFSVCEGVGRTLKGRDLSRVRNAVLIKTGFLESKPNH